MLAVVLLALLAAWTPPQPVIPDDNAPSAAKVELGRRLFYDVRLSGTGTYACASCHRPARAFTDGRRVAIGATGDAHRLNTPSLANVAFRPVLTTADAPVRRLEEQLLTPLLGTAPVEMAGDAAAILDTLRGDADYRARFAEAFGGEITISTLARAIAAFERTLISFAAPWDRGALTESAKRGEALFLSERTQCFRCHQPPHFTDTYRSADLPFDEIAFHDIGLTGRAATRLRAPSLRNVAVTAPYMHDGSLASLEDVIDHYAAGGQARESRSSYVTGFTLTPEERRDLVAFLESLTDQDFLSDPRLADPFAESLAGRR